MRMCSLNISVFLANDFVLCTKFPAYSMRCFLLNNPILDSSFEIFHYSANFDLLFVSLLTIFRLFKVLFPLECCCLCIIVTHFKCFSLWCCFMSLCIWQTERVRTLMLTILVYSPLLKWKKKPDYWGPVHTYPNIFESATFSFRIRLSSTRIRRKQIRKFLNPLSRVEIFKSDNISLSCGRSNPDIFWYDFVTKLAPVFTSQI